MNQIVLQMQSLMFLALIPEIFTFVLNNKKQTNPLNHISRRSEYKEGDLDVKIQDNPQV